MDQLIVSKKTICLQVLNKITLLERIRGCLGLEGLRKTCGIRLVGCKWIHTFFMRFQIDCLGLDLNQTVVAIHPKIPSARFVFFPKDVVSVLELDAGEAKRLGIIVGSLIELDLVSDHRVVSF